MLPVLLIMPLPKRSVPSMDLKAPRVPGRGAILPCLGSTAHILGAVDAVRPLFASLTAGALSAPG